MTNKTRSTIRWLTAKVIIRVLMPSMIGFTVSFGYIFHGITERQISALKVEAMRTLKLGQSVQMTGDFWSVGTLEFIKIRPDYVLTRICYRISPEQFAFSVAVMIFFVFLQCMAVYVIQYVEQKRRTMHK